VRGDRESKGKPLGILQGGGGREAKELCRRWWFGEKRPVGYGGLLSPNRVQKQRGTEEIIFKGDCGDILTGYKRGSLELRVGE